MIMWIFFRQEDMSRRLRRLMQIDFFQIKDLRKSARSAGIKDAITKFLL